MKKISIVLLVILLLLSMILPAQASTISPRYTYVDSIYARLDIDESMGIATCSGEFAAKYAALVHIEVDLQKYQNGQWVTIKSWSSEGTLYANRSGQYAIVRGYNYRAYARGYVYNEDGYVIEAVSVSDTEGFY